MPKFTYTGTNRNGESVKETVEAADRFAVYDIAREQGVLIAKVEEDGRFSLKRAVNMERINALLSRVSTDHLVQTTRNLSGMLKAGLPLSRALSVIERQSTNPRLKLVISDVRERVQKGDQFNQALGAHPRVFDDLYVSMVRAGEEGGGLADALGLLSVQMERAANLKKRIKSAMIYPTIVLTIMAGIGVVMMVYVMPTITGTFKNLSVELPASTRALIAISDFMAAHTVLVLASLIGGLVALVYFLRSRPGKLVFHFVLLHFPIIGPMAKEVNSARTARTLSSLLTAGVDVVRAIDITTAVVQNVYYKPVLASARAAVEAGKPLSEAFMARQDLYPVFVGEMLMVGEETGDLGGMLKELAVFYEDEVERKTKDLSTIIEPLLMVLIGSAVGFFALAMIAPIYSLTDSIG